MAANTTSDDDQAYSGTVEFVEATEELKDAQQCVSVFRVESDTVVVAII